VATERKRLDILVWRRQLAPSRAQAQALILAGKIAVDGQRLTQCGARVAVQADVKLLGDPRLYVSRGGEKLAAALEAFDCRIQDLTALDVGASTGGFTDCLLQAGARRVYAVDVGYGQLHWRLRNDPRVVVRERTHARYLTPQDFPERMNLLTVDASFISLRLLLPALVPLLTPQAEAILLIKPQFEAGRGEVGKGGVVRDARQHRQVLQTVMTAAQACGLALRAAIPSPLSGPKGNREFLAHLIAGVPLMPQRELDDLCAQLTSEPVS
jgi:23S rRNA (cytidine1920-2'-O)/16S rRNA (cytidine1409-2'-O)-methyltransferase